MRDRATHGERLRRYDLQPVPMLESDQPYGLTDLVDRAELLRKIKRYLD